MNIKKRLVRNTVINYLSTFVNIGVGFVLLPFLLNIIGPEQYGIYRLVLTLAGYLALMQIGVGTTTVKFVAQHLAKNEHQEINKLLTNSLLFYTGIGFIICLFLIISAFYLIGYFNIPEEFLADARLTLIISGVFSLFLWPLILFRKVLEGMQEYILTSGYTIIFSVVRLCLIFYFLSEGGGIIALIIIYFTTQILQNLVYLIYVIKKLSFLKFGVELVSNATYKKIFGFSWVLFAIQVFGMLIYQTDRIVLGVFLPISSLALYEGPWKFHSLIRRMNGIISSAVIPATSSLDAMELKRKIIELFLRGNKYAVILILPLTISIIMMAPYIVIYWLGSEYHGVIFATQLFVSYWLLNCSFSLSGAILIATNKMKYLLWYSISVTLGNLIISIILVNCLNNFIGVIWGTVIPYYIGYPVYLYFLLKLLKIPFSKFLNRVIIPTYPIATFPIITGIALLKVHLPANLLETGAYMIIITLSYWLISYFVSFRKRERDDLKQIVRSIVR